MGGGFVSTHRRVARVSTLLVGFVVALSLFAGSGVVGTAQAAEAPVCDAVTLEGSGTEADPFEVSTLDQLQCIGQTPDGSNSDGEYYELQNDIDASETATWNDGAGFEPLSGGLSFSGTIDGNGFVISNLSIDRPDERYVGLVGFFSDTSRDNVSLEGIHLESVDITGSENVGGVVGNNRGTVSNASVSGRVTATSGSSVGGVVGSGDGDVRDSSSTASVTGSERVGGLVGYLSGGTVNDSSATGSVTGTDAVGGLVGQSEATVRNASATGQVDGSDRVGGLVGLNRGDVNDSSAAGDVTGSERVGGLVGDNTDVFPGRGDVHNSSASGDVDGTRWVGGFMGYNRGGTLRTSTAAGSTNGSQYVGGFVGSNSDGAVSDSSATGDVTGGASAAIGGFVGSNGGTVTTSSATGSVTGDGGVVGDDSEFGGFVGYNDATVNTSYATGDVTGGEFTNGGGFVGSNEFGAAVNTSYATGSVTGAFAAEVGGFVGNNANGAAVNESYAAGRVTVTGGGLYLGGFAGDNRGTIGDGYWDSDRSGEGTGVDRGASDGVTELTTTEMEGSASENTFMSDLFASGVWTSVAGDYPDLVANPRTVSTPHFDAPTGTEMDTILAEMETEGGDTIVTSDRALQAINRDSTARSDDYRLGLDIDASGTDEWNSGDGFSPIGPDTNQFSGSFDGDGHVISELHIDRSAKLHVGLFGNVTAGSTIEDVGIESVNVSGNDWVAGLVGKNLGGTVRESYVTGNVTGDSSVGGLVGEYDGNGGTITDSYATATVTARVLAGGLIGTKSGDSSVNGSYATGNVTGTYLLGGLVGTSYNGTIQDSYATGNVNGIEHKIYSINNIGGLIGTVRDGTTVTESYAAGNVTADGTEIGGLVGTNTDGSTVNESYATGSVTGGTNVGGLVGQNDATVTDAYATGRVRGTDTGGAIGVNDGGTIEAVYWDTETTGQSTSDGSETRFGLPSERMTGLNATVGLFEFDFENTWQPASRPGGYPTLAGDSAFSDRAEAYDGLVEGNGSSDNPYRVSTVYELQLITSRLGEGDSFELADDINASRTDGWFDEGSGPQGFEPVGNGTSAFNGTFDGAGYVITDLFINRSSDDDIGLFGYVESDGSVSDVDIESANVTGRNEVGGLVGTNAGNVRASSVTGEINGSRAVGGLVGRSGGTLNASYSTGRINGSIDVGGLVGYTFGTVRKSYATGRVDGTSKVGGLIGSNSDVVNRSYATGRVDGDRQVGGLVGRNGGTVSESSAAGGINGTAEVGGLVGNNFDTVSESSATGRVDGSDVDVGGLIGLNEGSVTESFATGRVNGTDIDIGGLVGRISGHGTVEDSYWDKGTTNRSVAVGSGTGTNLTGFGTRGDDTSASEMQGPSAIDYISNLSFASTWSATDAYPLVTAMIDELDLTLAADNLTVGQSTEANVTLTLIDNATTVTATTTSQYSSDDTSVATIDDATVRATGAGTVVLTAETGVTGTEHLSVVSRPSVGGGGGGGGSPPPALELRVTDEKAIEATGGRAGDVVRISDETTSRSGSLDPGENIAVEGLSIELANDRDFWIDVETFERDEFDANDAESDETDASSESTLAATFETETGTVSVGYVTITHNLEPKDIESVQFEFNVRRSYLDDLDVESGSVTLYRQTDEWSTLRTEYAGTNASRYQFTAISPGFSSFAIGTGAAVTEVTDATLAQSELIEGESASVTATVENRGETEAEHAVELLANGEVVATETITLGPGETSETTLSFSPVVGEYELSVGGHRLESLTVAEAPSDDSPAPAEEDETEDGGFSLLGLLLVALIVITALAALLWRRGNRDESASD